MRASSTNEDETMKPSPNKAAALSMAMLAAVLAVPSMRGQANVANRTVQLPPFFVEDSNVKFSVWNWGYMAFPGYEVLTYCNRTTTNGFVYGIARQAAILHDIAPAVFETEPSVPTALILMDQSQEATISEDMKKVMKEPPADTNTAMSGLTMHRIFLPQLRLNDTESTAVNLILGNLNNLDIVVLEPSYVRYLMEQRTPRLPTWYVEAMTDLYRRAYFGSKSVTFSPIDWTTEKETEALRRDAKHPRTLLPMDSILFTRPGSAGASEEEKARVRLWECQSELFLQWILNDDSRGRIAALKKFLDLDDHGARNENAFRKCFGVGFAEAENLLSAFLPTAVRDSVAFYSSEDRVDIPLRDATKSEYARIWGNWELMEIQFVKAQDPDLVYPYVAQADQTLKGGFRKGERDPGFLAVLGLYGSDMNDPEVARPALEAAVAARAPYPRIYVELARLCLKDALAAPVGPGKKLSLGQAGAILGLLREARRLSPPQSAAYLLHALTLANGTVPPTPKDMDILEEGLRNFPRDAELAATVAALRQPAKETARGAHQMLADCARRGIARLNPPTPKKPCQPN
jgi:hypothetical protein